jgi:hypothetical protein
MLLAKAARLLRPLFHIDADDRQRVAVLSGDADNIGRLGITRRKPRREKLQPDGTTDQFAERENAVALAVEFVQTEIACVLPRRLRERQAPRSASRTARDPRIRAQAERGTSEESTCYKAAPGRSYGHPLGCAIACRVRTLRGTRSDR